MTPGGSGAVRPEGPATWQQALDRLEAHADRAERAIRGQSVESVPPWTPPTDLGPIPGELVARTRELLERQLRLMAEIPTALDETRRQQRVADRVSDATTGARPPVYLDVTA